MIEYGIEEEVVQVSVFLASVMVEVDEIFDVVVRANIFNILISTTN